MNPLIIAGILAVTVSSVAMMISFSDQQVKYANTSEKTSSIQAQRLAEGITGTMDGDRFVLKNTGSVPVDVREIRVLDDLGHVIMVQGIDQRIAPSQTVSIDAGSDIMDILRSAESGD